MAPVFKNVGEKITVRNYLDVSLLSTVSEVFEKPVNKRLVDHLRFAVWLQVFFFNCSLSGSCI